jgi:AcrR family transcriptional regulator
MTDTHERLIAATLRCVERKGLAATTSRDIAAEAGANLAGITYHFGSKDELVAQALLRAMRRLLDPVLDVLRSDLDPAARTAAGVQALQASFAEAGELLPVYLEARLHARHDAALGRELAALLGELHTFLADQLGDMRAAGQIPRWVEPDAMAVVLVAMADGVAVRSMSDPTLDAAAVGAQALQLLITAR